MCENVKDNQLNESKLNQTVFRIRSDSYNEVLC